MNGKRLASCRSLIDIEDEEETAANPFSGNVVLGDLIWVRLNAHSWWPAQVTDENTVGGSNKPGNRSKGEVLVRLYGSYDYLYVDPMKFQSEFENVLEQNNGSYSDIFRKALEQDMPNSKPGRGKGKGSKSKENASVVASRDELLKKKDKELEASNSKTRVLTVDASGSEGTKKHSVEKNHLMDKGSPSMDSPRKPTAADSLKIDIKISCSPSKKPEDKTKAKKLKQDGPRKKLKPDNQSSEGNIPKTGVKKGKTPKQDISTPNVGAKNVKLVLKGTPTSKAIGVQNKPNPNSPSLVTISLGTSQELSARRTKVMQSLGLIAPSGSPFQRNRRIMPRS